MSISINYKGRTGNHLFQYVAARLFADKLGLKLKTDFDDPDLVKMDPQPGGAEVDGPEKVITDFDNVLSHVWERGRYRFDGFFQNADWFYAKREQILRFAHPEPVYMRSGRDLLMNVRLGDFKAMGWVIDPSWYLEILRNEKFDRLHIVTDEADPVYLSSFKQFDPIIVSGGKKLDWNYLRSFDRMICSNSTFCWWAVFFSGPSKVYVFKRWVGLYENNLRIPGSVEVDGKFQKEVP